jgi:hypothetical protein
MNAARSLAEIEVNLVNEVSSQDEIEANLVNEATLGNATFPGATITRTKLHRTDDGERPPKNDPRN